MTTFGFELEMSDIKTVDAAEIVYEDLTLWVDRWGGYSKPILNYENWHLQSDGSIKNSDGTRCMFTYIDEDGILRNANSGRGSSDRYKWRGAELVSPVLDEKTEWKTTVDNYIKKFQEKGAVFESYLYDALHIHIGIPDIDFEEIKLWPRYAYALQTELNNLGNSWNGRRVYEEVEVEALANAETEAEFLNILLRKNGKQIQPYVNAARRIVNVLHWFSPAHANTIEFRCFKSVPSSEYIEACINLCLYIVEQWSNKVIVDSKDNTFMDLYYKVESIAERML